MIESQTNNLLKYTYYVYMAHILSRGCIIFVLKRLGVCLCAISFIKYSTTK